MHAESVSYDDASCTFLSVKPPRDDYASMHGRRGDLLHSYDAVDFDPEKVQCWTFSVGQLLDWRLSDGRTSGSALSQRHCLYTCFYFFRLEEINGDAFGPLVLVELHYVHVRLDEDDTDRLTCLVL